MTEPLASMSGEHDELVKAIAVGIRADYFGLDSPPDDEDIDIAKSALVAIERAGYRLVRSEDVAYAISFLMAPPMNDQGQRIVDETVERLKEVR